MCTCTDVVQWCHHISTMLWATLKPCWGIFTSDARSSFWPGPITWVDWECGLKCRTEPFLNCQVHFSQCRFFILGSTENSFSNFSHCISSIRYNIASSHLSVMVWQRKNCSLHSSGRDISGLWTTLTLLKDTAFPGPTHNIMHCSFPVGEVFVFFPPVITSAVPTSALWDPQKPESADTANSPKQSCVLIIIRWYWIGLPWLCPLTNTY